LVEGREREAERPPRAVPVDLGEGLLPERGEEGAGVGVAPVAEGVVDGGDEGGLGGGPLALREGAAPEEASVDPSEEGHRRGVLAEGVVAVEPLEAVERADEPGVVAGEGFLERRELLREPRGPLRRHPAEVAASVAASAGEGDRPGRGAAAARPSDRGTVPGEMAGAGLAGRAPSRLASARGRTAAGEEAAAAALEAPAARGDARARAAVGVAGRGRGR